MGGHRCQMVARFVSENCITNTDRVRFSPWVARWIREDRWHPTQRFTDLPDGSLQVDMLVTGSIDVKRWILSFGKDAEVLAPKHLRAEIAADAAEMGRNYA